MDDADRQYFEAMERLFDSADWKIFANDIDGWLERIASQWKTLRPDQLQFEQGRYDGLTQVRDHYKLVEQLRAMAEADAAANTEVSTDHV